ncbi:MAG: ABC-2 family transporter protein [Deltaproteobacteria bacterium]|nr:ABC-2 family transporter protein [Deltaproteobacteria bacterium]
MRDGRRGRTLLRYLDYLRICFRMSVFRALEYRSGVFFQYVVDIVWYVVQFALLRTAFSYVAEVAGYNLAECYLFLAFLFSTDAVSMLFFNGGLEHFTRSVRTGGLDFYILKPMPTLYQMTVARVSLAGLLNLGFTVFFWGYVLRRFQVHYSFAHWLWAILLFTNGIFVNITFRLTISCLSLWTIEGGSLNWLFHELMRFGSKPEAIYGKWARRILISVVPALLLSAWPCMALIRKPSYWALGVPFLVSAVAGLALAGIWRLGLRRYEGLSFQA